jgi:D-beta-D-heptose 7-phosphate kinase/D-beta-D-heptose 1-phosphate adenosyltransferase
VARVFTNGCFDILHRGHIELLDYCRSLGNVTVGLNSDFSVKRLKGPERPINSEQDRKMLLEAMRSVDEVIIFDEDTPYELIKKLDPDIIIKGGDYNSEDVVGNDICEVRIFKYIDGYSTSNTINQISKIRKGSL